MRGAPSWMGAVVTRFPQAPEGPAHLAAQILSASESVPLPPPTGPIAPPGSETQDLL